MKKLLLCFSYIFFSFIYISTAKTYFEDDWGEWEVDTGVFDKENYLNAAEYLQNNGIVQGYNENGKIIFKPKNTINRAEFTKILVEILPDKQEAENTCEIILEQAKKENAVLFSDINPNEWYTPYICIARISNLIKGYPDRTFKPANNISFVEATKVIVKVISKKYKEDIPIGDPWYLPYVEYLSNKNAIPYSIRSLNKHITRGEMAEIIYRLKMKITDKTSQEIDYLLEPKIIGNKYDISALQIGDRVGGMTVAKIDKTTDFVTNWIIFKGDIRIKGKYINYFPCNKCEVPNALCMGDFDESSKKLIPDTGTHRLYGHYVNNKLNDPVICFKLDENDLSSFINKDGYAEITINKLTTDTFGREDYGIIKKVHSISSIKNECKIRGGKWDENATRGTLESEDGIIFLNGFCFLPDHPKFDKIVPFDDCGQITNYKNYRWFPTFERNITNNNIILSQISEACYSQKGNILVFIVPETFGSVKGVYRYNTNKSILERAKFETWGYDKIEFQDEYPDDWHGSEFHLRKGSIIPVFAKRTAEECNAKEEDYARESTLEYYGQYFNDKTNYYSTSIYDYVDNTISHLNYCGVLNFDHYIQDYDFN